MLGGTLSTSPAQFTTIVASMFVNKTKTTLRAHTQDKNTSSVCGSKRRFRPNRTARVYFYLYTATQFLIVAYSHVPLETKRIYGLVVLISFP